MAVEGGQRGVCSYRVTPADTAAALGSGDLEVLGTPRLLAWMEAATVAALATGLGPDETSVGTRVELEHLAAVRAGAEVEVTADVVYSDGRLLRFSVVATSGSVLLGTATITRVVVGRERFLARVPSPQSG